MGNTIQRPRKKLIAAARVWAGGTPSDDPVDAATILPAVDDGVLASLVAMNAPPEVLAEFEAAKKPQQTDFEVHQDNWEIFQLFTALKTQWQLAAGMAGVIYIGLSYPAVEAFFNLLNIPKKQRPEKLRDIQIMEHAALAVLNQVKESA